MAISTIYCKIWKLNIKINTTNEMMFGSNRRSWRNYKFTVKQLIQQTATHIQGLCLVLLGNLIKPLSIWLHSTKASHLLYSRIYNLDLLIDLQLKFFYHTILPILTYACKILGSENLQEYEKLHSCYFRKITNSYKIFF